ncbi:MAG: FAD-dependent oxidoreductase [Wenzhouxiangellaceae bacterium]|nr:FAD-dependent oxidoreductase [Wenzhouxiangellaceae bacterium]
MRIAVVGGGVAGLYAAWQLAGSHEVVLYERNGRLGGHTDTHKIDLPDGTVAVDTGFIVFNEKHYPLFSAWLDALGVNSRVSDMSFGFASEVSGLEYNATRLNTLFCQRRNLVRPRFLAMVRDILRFYRRAPALLQSLDDRTTLGQWLTDSGLGPGFADDHLVPMAAALWSSPDRQILDFPMRSLLEFMHNHDMLQVDDRPIWRTIVGGSQRYVEAALARFDGELRLNAPVYRIQRSADGRVGVTTADGEDCFDQVVLACHADQALAMIGAPNTAEREVLGAFDYQPNETVLHTDASRMPRNRRAWAAWNVRQDRDAPTHSGISYWMNRLQGLECDTPLIVSLNQTSRIDPDRILKVRRYRHPIFTPGVRAAQRRIDAINGRDRLWFCGACWGFGFHEDAVRSARAVVDGIQADVVRDAA